MEGDMGRITDEAKGGMGASCDEANANNFLRKTRYNSVTVHFV